MTFCTYLYRDPKDGILRYVGKGHIGRAYKHLSRSHNIRLDRMIKKRIAEGFKISPIIIQAASNEDAIEMEMLLIEMIGRDDLRKGPLFNVTDGGEGQTGWKPSQQNIENMRSRQLEIGSRPEIKEMRRVNATNQYTPSVLDALKLRKCKPCTVDGIKVYPSRLAMIQAIGQSKKTGCKQPSFRYL